MMIIRVFIINVYSWSFEVGKGHHDISDYIERVLVHLFCTIPNYRAEGLKELHILPGVLNTIAS